MTDYSKIEQREIISSQLHDCLDSMIKQGVYEDELYSFLVQEANNIDLIPGYQILKLTNIDQDPDSGNLHFYFNVLENKYYDN